MGRRGRAKDVALETLVRPAELPGQRRDVLPGPYREGLRLDEAMHPLALLATGMYGRELPGQNGAQRRLGGPRWRRLHRLAYVAGLAAVVHFLWLVKADPREPLVYGAALACCSPHVRPPSRGGARAPLRRRRGIGLVPIACGDRRIEETG